MNNYIINVNFEKKILYTDLQKLVKNDYNSTKINFTFDKEGRILFKMMYPDGNIYVTQIDNNELILTKGILNQDGRYEIEISLYTDDSRLTDYMTASFEVRKELVETDDLVEVDERLPILDTLIVEINGYKLYLNEVKKQVENGEFNGKDGRTPTIGENGNWFIGEVDTGKPSQGPAGGVTIEEVEAITGELKNLPTEDKTNIVNAIIELFNSSGGEAIPHLINETITLYNHEPGLYLLSGSKTNIKYKFDGSGSHKPFSNDETTGYLFCVRLNAGNQGYGILLTATLSGGTTITIYDNTTYKNIYIKDLVTSSITGNLSNLQTTNKNNLVSAINEVANNSGGESQFIELNLVLESSTTSSNPLTIDSTKNASQLEVLSKAINEYVTNPRPFLLNIKVDNGNVYNNHYNVVVNNFVREPKLTQNYPLFNYSLINGYELTSWNLSIDGNWTNNVFTCTSASIGYDVTRSLMGTNDYSTITGQKAFNTIPKCSVTPTSNAHLTNKKYVDDAITSAIEALKAELGAS